MLDLSVGGPAVLDRQLGQLVADRLGTPRRVDAEPGGDRQHPRAQVVAVLEPVVCPQGTEKCLLKGIFGSLRPEPAAQEAEHHVAVLDVEELERRDGGHCLHHLG